MRPRQPPVQSPAMPSRRWSAMQRWKALSAALETIRHAVNVTTERYKRGDTEFRVLLGEQCWKYAREERVAIAAEIATLRYVAFYKALGGGWELYDELPPLPPVQLSVVAGVGRLIGGWR
jgi:outer membrane protein TolC